MKKQRYIPPIAEPVLLEEEGVMNVSGTGQDMPWDAKSNGGFFDDEIEESEYEEQESFEYQSFYEKY